jgi:predicted acetyltransferase
MHCNTSGPLPTSTYDAVVDGAIVGSCQIRHHPTNEARRIGLGHVRLTVTDDNPTSHHIIEDAGGQLVGEFTARTGELYRLFEISVL